MDHTTWPAPDATQITFEEAHPLRCYRIYLPTEPDLAMHTYAECLAHYHECNDGRLELFTLSGTMAWTTEVFAPGEWTHMRVSAPSADALAVMKKYEENRQQIAKVPLMVKGSKLVN